jgi:hypothetical protein
MYALGTFVKNQMTVAMWIFFWVFYSVPLVLVPVFGSDHLLLLLHGNLWAHSVICIPGVGASGFVVGFKYGVH